MAAARKTALRLPKLKTRDELLKTAPELARFLADDPEAQQRAHSAYRRGASAGTASSPSRLPFLDSEVTEEEQLRAEVERVKHERAGLMESLAKLRLDQGKSGGELQQEDIRILRREIEAKKEKLSELAKEARRLMDLLEGLELTSQECEQLMPQSALDLEARVQQLTEELGRVEESIVEAEAKSELYKLLEARTRRDHQASEQLQRESRQLKEDATDDFTTLTKHMHEMRAAKEDAERELAAAVGVLDQVRSDWRRKLADRRKEVNEMERRKAEDRQRQEQQHALQEEKERVERAKAARAKQELEVQEARASRVMPQLEALEAQWARLHALTGADSPDDVISHWKDLKQKEANMRELVKLAEVREARAKEEMARLLEARAEVYDAGASNDGARDAEGSTTAAAEAVAAEASSHVFDEKAQRIADATRRKQVAKKKFNKLSQVCVAADQGLHLLLGRLDAAASSPAVTMDAADRRTSAAGTRRQTRRISSVRHLSASAFMESRRASLAGATMPLPHNPRRETQPVGSTIHEKEFFPELPALLQGVGERLDRILAVATQLEASAVAGGSGGASESCEASPEETARGPGTRTPRTLHSGGQERGVESLPPKSEAALRKGFRRQTLAGPPWLEAVAAKAPHANSLRKGGSGKAGCVASPGAPRVAGNVWGGSAGSSSEEEDPYSIDSSEDEDDAVLDREMLKHRAHKLLLAKRKAASAAASPTAAGVNYN